MEKIIINKRMLYYKSKTFSHFANIEKIVFDTFDEAMTFLDNYKINYIINKKDISAIEELSIVIHDKNNVKKYTKTIDFLTGEPYYSKPQGVA